MAADTALAIITAALWYVADRLQEPLRTLFFAVGLLTMAGVFFAISFPNETPNAIQVFLTVSASLFFIVFAIIMIFHILPGVLSWLKKAVRK